MVSLLSPNHVKMLIASLLIAMSIRSGSAYADIQIQSIALSGEAAPDSAAGVVYSGYFGEHPSINNAGDVAFIAGLRDATGQTENALFGPTAGSGSPLGKLFDIGSLAPGFDDGTTINAFKRGVVLNTSGDVAFLAGIDSPSLGLAANAIFGPSAGAGSPTSMIVRRDDPNLGFSGNINFLQRSGSQPAINDAGKIAFVATLGLTSVETIYGPAAGGTGYAALVSQQDTPPGVPAGRRYEQFNQVSLILETGEVAYEALLSYRNESGIRRFETRAFAASEQGVRLLGPPRAVGDPVPGRDDGALFSGVASDQSVNAQGDVLFTSSFKDASDETILGWFAPTTGPGSEYGLVVQKNIPRVFDGEVIDIRGTGPSALNSNADFAFIGAYAIDPSQPVTRDLGIALFVQMDGQLELIAKEGNLFDVAADTNSPDLRRITEIGIASDSFNDQGQVLFELNFEDGSSGLFVATVPEPGAGLLFAALGLSVLSRRRRAS